MPEENSLDGTPIAFAFYRNKQLYGYRIDTVGNIDLSSPKIYHYSKEVVEKVLANIAGTMSGKDNYLVELIKGADKRLGAIVGNNIRNNRKALPAYEVRIVVAPEYEYTEEVIEHIEQIFKWPIYPSEEVEEWLKTPKEHSVLETHYFTSQGILVLS